MNIDFIISLTEYLHFFADINSMMEEPEEAGTRYEIHIQNEDGTSTGEVIVVYSNDGTNDPAQVLPSIFSFSWMLTYLF